MKILYFLCFSAISIASASAQVFDFEALTIDELKIFSDKEKIITVLGDPDRIYDPEYECGYFSTETQGKPSELLSFEKLGYIGTPGEEYVAERIPLDGPFEIRYKDVVVNSKMNLDQLIAVFGERLMGRFHDAYTGQELIKIDSLDYWVCILSGRRKAEEN